MIWFLLVAAIVVGSYFLFKDTLNRIQYIQTIRLYWITKDAYPEGTPRLSFARMYQTAPPWWQGKGVQLRVSKYVVQVGVLTSKGSDLLDQLGGRYLDESPKQLREWDGTAKAKAQSE